MSSGISPSMAGASGAGATWIFADADIEAMTSIGGSATITSVATGVGSTGSSTTTFLVVFLTFARAFTTSTLAEVSTAVEASPSALPNHSRTVCERPTETADIWLVMSGISSATHLATMSLLDTPSSLASVCTLRAIVFFLATWFSSRMGFPHSRTVSQSIIRTLSTNSSP